jgi:hypothetical protein
MSRPIKPIVAFLVLLLTGAAASIPGMWSNLILACPFTAGREQCAGYLPLHICETVTVKLQQRWLAQLKLDQIGLAPPGCDTALL